MEREWLVVDGDDNDIAELLLMELERSREGNEQLNTCIMYIVANQVIR